MNWGTVFLGIIALATLTIAVVLVAVFVAAGRAAWRIGRLADRIEQELAPIAEHLNSIARDASKTAALASSQMERIDRIFGQTAKRLDDVGGVLRAVVGGPAGRGVAVAAAVRALFAILRNVRARRRRRTDEEDALFI